VRLALVAPLVAPIKEPQLGGAQSMMSDVASGLAGRGHRVDVFAATGSEIAGACVVDLGIESRDMASTRFSFGAASATTRPGQAVSQQAFRTIFQTIAEGDYDVVHNHAADTPAFAEARFLDIPVIHTLHLPPNDDIADEIRIGQAGAHPPAIAAVSHHSMAAWSTRIQVNFLIKNGVPTKRIAWSASGGEGLLFAGRFSPEKGAFEALEIAGRAGVPVTLIGDAYDEDYAHALRMASAKAKHEVQIRAATARPALWELMTKCLAVLCPIAWEEPFGLVAAEAQAAGAPVVGFRRGALAEVVLDGTTGFLVDAGDLDAAASAVGRSGALSRAACRRHAERDLDLEATLDAHEQMYERTVAGLSTAGNRGQGMS